MQNQLHWLRTELTLPAVSIQHGWHSRSRLLVCQCNRRDWPFDHSIIQILNFFQPRTTRPFDSYRVVKAHYFSWLVQPAIRLENTTNYPWPIFDSDAHISNHQCFCVTAGQGLVALNACTFGCFASQVIETEDQLYTDIWNESQEKEALGWNESEEGLFQETWNDQVYIGVWQHCSVPVYLTWSNVWHFAEDRPLPS